MGTEVVKVKVEKPTQASFAKFGKLIKLPESKPSVDMPGVLSYWDQVVNLDFRQGDPELGFLIAKFRPFEFASMERHVNSDETFIPLEGRACLFALAPATGSREYPNPGEIKAFILDGTFGINLSRGVWHSAPFPLADQMSFILALRKGTVEEDIDLKETEKGLGMRFIMEI
ncbi:MAG: ureidoglycolate lyase [Bacteroidota bacterium]